MLWKNTAILIPQHQAGKKLVIWTAWRGFARTKKGKFLCLVRLHESQINNQHWVYFCFHHFRFRYGRKWCGVCMIDCKEIHWLTHEQCIGGRACKTAACERYSTLLAVFEVFEYCLALDLLLLFCSALSLSFCRTHSHSMSAISVHFHYFIDITGGQ